MSEKQYDNFVKAIAKLKAKIALRDEKIAELNKELDYYRSCM